MSQSLKCPSCGAPLEIENQFAAIIACDFCGVSSQANAFGEQQNFQMNFGGSGLLEQARKLKEIKQLALSGKAIHAIKIYRETFGVGLAEAKAAVDNIIAGKPIVFTNVQSFTAHNDSSGVGDAVEQALKIGQIQSELQAGRKINAIKIFRETFGCGLAEAKNAVEAIERGESLNLNDFGQAKSSFAANENYQTNRKDKSEGSFFGQFFLVIALIIGITILAAWLISSSIEKSSHKTSDNFSVNSGKNEASRFAKEILRIGGEGIGAGMFKDNRSVAVDPDGRIYSAEYSGGKVQVFEASGKFLTQWTADPKTVITAIAANRKGNLYLLESSSGIKVYEGATGKLLQESERIYGEGMALTLDGRVIVTSRDGFIILDANTLKSIREFKDAAERADATFGFEQVAVDGDGIIYVLDEHNGDVCKFSMEGKFLNRFKSDSSSPNAIVIDPKGRIFVSDTSHINVFDADGKKINSFDERQVFGLAFSDQGELYVASRPYVVKYQLQN